MKENLINFEFIVKLDSNLGRSPRDYQITYKPAPSPSSEPEVAFAPEPFSSAPATYNEHEIAAIKEALNNIHSLNYIPPSKAPSSPSPASVKASPGFC